MSLAIVRTRAELGAIVAAWKAAGETVGVVPTMGALHAGHLSLVHAAKSGNDRVIVTLFVNPRQFNNAADLVAYPRTEETDVRALAPLAVDVLYVPDGSEMYPKGFSTTVSVTGVSEGLCGAYRPGHFDGVATVVTKLLLQTGAERAYFGQKDWQQLQVVTRLVADLDIPCEIVGCPIVREPDGLALSSRNLRLSAAERAIAPAFAAALHAAARAIATGTPVADAIERAGAEIVAAGFASVEYLELRRDADLAPADTADAPCRLLAAAWLGDVRLIDNVPLPAST